MKRDLNFIRDILLLTESQVNAFTVLPESFPEKTFNEVGYHVDLLINKHFIEGKVTWASGHECIKIYIEALTWDGADFLDSIRSDSVWEKTKDAIKRTVGETSLDIIKRVAFEISLKLIMQSI